MIVSNEYRQIIEERFNEVRELAKGRSHELFSVLDTCNEDEAICLKYLYAFMPEQDLANYDGELFLKFVRAALEMRKQVAWGEKLTDSLFLNYVLQYRINNENVEFYKEAFASEIFPRIKDMNMHDATIETNYWCFEKATYQSTDIRTASPFTVLKNTYGRCGEESTLLTAALRSVGIPARQVYAPRWAHCDDNHAWVEAWIDGEWHFLGACEPEMKMDTGWFMLPASKGMLIHSKPLSTLIEDEEIVYQTKVATEVNLLSHYADTKRVTVKVKDAKGNALAGAHVRFELINYSELFALAELETDNNGEVSFLTGFGDLMICAHKNGAHAYGQMDVRKEDTLEITVPDAFVKEEGMREFTLIPATGKNPVEEELAEDVKAKHEAKHSNALAIRAAFKDTFYTGERAEAFAKDYAPFEAEVKEAMEKSLGNYAELIKFFQDEETAELLEWKVKLLSTLNKKDFTDITFEILKAHLQGAIAFKDQYEEDIFVNHLLAPRVVFEMITAYREGLAASFDEETKANFMANPKAIYEYILSEVKAGEETEYSTFYAEPEGLLKLKVGNKVSRKVLFVAICRSFGIPAKFNKDDQTVSYFKEGNWVTLGTHGKEVKKTSKLTLVKENKEQAFDYYKNFTVGKLIHGVYRSFELEGVSFEEDTLEMAVEAGRYRIITTDRQADGTIHGRMYYAEVSEGEEAVITIDISRKEDTKHVVELKDATVKTLEGETRQLKDLVGTEQAIVAYLEVSGEPTEHLLNEMLDSLDKYSTLKPHILFMLKDASDINDPTLAKVLKVLPHIELYVREEEVNLDHLYEAFEIHDKKLPLAYVMHEPMKAKYAWAGYNVGIGELLLKYLG